MASPSVSFRISRSAEDLAGTLHLLSQRLVRLEQRLEALEGQRQASQQEDPGLEESLGNAERLLLDCRALLELDVEPAFDFEVPENQARDVEADEGETEIPRFSSGAIDRSAA
jgi:predicted  nucleic acid-binding Zn-ribbon protein